MENAIIDQPSDSPQSGAAVYLFLDFDGVLHDEPPELELLKDIFEHVPAFESVLRETDPDGRVKIVISSAWRIEEGLDELRAHFSPDVAERIVGMTPILPVPDMGWAGLFTRGHRQAEIQSWMAANAPGGQWFAIDDRAEGFHKPYDNLVLVTPHSEDGRGLDEYSLREVFWAIKDRIDPPLQIKPNSSLRP